MKIINDYQCPNIQDLAIPVEFVVLHYTACNLEKTLKILLDSQTKVSSHFVIDTNGDCYDLGNFIQSDVRRGPQSQPSSLNDVSVGIELVNLNGNLFDYTAEQYNSLATLVTQLQERFTLTKDPSRIVGHEHIAYWKGKSDPGQKFDWKQLFGLLGLEPLPLHAYHACESADLDFLNERVQAAKSALDDPEFWPTLNLELEQRIASRSS